MTFPALSSLSGLLTGAITEDFKKLIRTGAPVNAAIWLAAQLLLIAPVLLQRDVRRLLAPAGLDAWLALAGALVLSAVSFVLSALDDCFLNLLNGRSLGETVGLGPLLVSRERRAYRRLTEQLSAYAGAATDIDRHRLEGPAARAVLALATEFPDEPDLLPTRFGNVQAATAAYVWHQYGAHLGALWPALTLFLQAKDDKLSARLQAHEAGLTFLATLCGLLFLIGLELAVVHLAVGSALQALWALAFCLAGYLVYLSAVQTAREWGRDARLAFARHLEDLGQETFGFRAQAAYGDTENRKQRWQGFSRWLLYGALASNPPAGTADELAWPLADPAWFNAAPGAPPPVTLVHPATLTVICQESLIETDQARGIGTGRVLLADKRRAVTYTLFITNPSAGKGARTALGGALVSTDTRLLAVPEVVAGLLNGVSPITGQRLPAAAGKPEGVLWSLPPLAPGETLTLAWRLSSDAYVAVTSGNATITALQVPASGPGLVELELAYPAGATGDVVLEMHGANAEQWAEHGNYLVGDRVAVAVLARIPGQPARTLTIPMSPGAPPPTLSVNFRFVRL